MDNLINALERLLRPPEPGRGGSVQALGSARRAQIRDLLYRADGGLGAFLPLFQRELKIEQSISDRAREQANLLIVIDQFEELFRDENRVGKHQQVADLVNLVVHHWRCRGEYEGLYLALTMRTDDLHRCAEFLELPDFINATSYLIRRLRDDELRDAIVSPVRPPLFRARLLQDDVELGEADTRPFDVEVVSDLVDAVEEIGHDPDHLPLLQHLLAVVWRQAVKRWRLEAQVGRFELPPRVTRDDLGHALEFQNWRELEAYRRAKGPPVPGWLLRQCLDRVAEGLLLGDLFGTPLTERQRDIARVAFCLMGEIDDRGNVKRRWTTSEEIAQVAGLNAPSADVDAVIHRFSLDHRLIWVRQSGEVDVCHEALMRNWQQLKDWLDQDREASQAYLQLARRFQAWCDANAASPGWLTFLTSWVRKKGRLLGSDTLERLLLLLTRRKGMLGGIRSRYNSHWARRYLGAPAANADGRDGKALAEREHRERFNYLLLSKRRAAVIDALPLLTTSLLVVTLALVAWQQQRDDTKAILLGLARRTATHGDQLGMTDGAQLALWARHLAWLLHIDSFDQTDLPSTAKKALDHARAVARRDETVLANHLAGEGLARAIAAIAEQDMDSAWREEALSVAQLALAGTGSAEESAAWARAIVALMQPLERHQRAGTLVEVLKYPTAALTAREPNARQPENATDILIRALRDTVDPQLQIDDRAPTTTCGCWNGCSKSRASPPSTWPEPRRTRFQTLTNERASGAASRDCAHPAAAAAAGAGGGRGRGAARGCHPDADRHVLALHRALAAGRYRPDPWRLRIIHDPKTRLIAAPSLRDWIVHRALLDEIGPIYEA